MVEFLDSVRVKNVMMLFVRRGFALWIFKDGSFLVDDSYFYLNSQTSSIYHYFQPVPFSISFATTPLVLFIVMCIEHQDLQVFKALASVKYKRFLAARQIFDRKAGTAIIRSVEPLGAIFHGKASLLCASLHSISSDLVGKRIIQNNTDF